MFPIAPELLADLGSAAAVAALLWWRIGRVETKVGDLGRKVDEQNGRIDDLELWRERREGFREGAQTLHQRKQKDHG